MAGLTEQQHKALNLEDHISVTANAGSGKTRVLTERYVEAVRNGTDVEQILCLTFTDKAALELKERIGARINSEIAGEKISGGHSNYPNKFRNAKSKMLEANISTIHSFCSQVLREFPVEAGVDANFKVLEDFDSATLKEESCTRAVREALAEERTIHGNAYKILVRLGYKRTLKLLFDLLNSREKIEHIKITGHQLLMTEAVVREHWRNLSDAVTRIARENVKLKKGNLTAEIKEMEGSFGDDGDVLNPLTVLLRKILTKEGNPRKREATIVDGPTYSSDVAILILKVAQESLSQFSLDRKTIKDYFQLLQTLLDLFEKSVEHYDRKKFAISALDFDDLQIKTMHLLRENQSVRTTLTSRFKHIMVDEFQDTNFLQYDIFLNLIDNFSGETKLFVVGDPKQSIYRFRNAQVEVSIRAETQISGLKKGAAIPLLESFRMNTELASFVNKIFSSEWIPSGKAITQDRVLGTIGLPSPFQTEYKPLIAGRPNGAEPAVEIFLARENKKDEMSEDDSNVDSSSEFSTSEQQALFVASRINEMIVRNETVRDVKLNEETRKIKYGDIAILLRSRSRLEILEEALNKKNVPYSVTSGIGFYSAQEIFDLTNYLTFLLDNNSDIGLLTVLRSPFFGVSDDELFKVSLVDGETLFERFESFARTEGASDEVRYASSVLVDEIQLAHRLTIPQLINRILERTGWLGAYRLSATGEQRIANMKKLLGVAREFEGRGFNNLYDFVERLKYLKETVREGQAIVEETADVVKIMTVHAAKGLEFPVVIVPFCEATTTRRQSLIANDQIGVLPFISNEVPPEMSLYQRFERQNEQAEIARLFYVACTRAMDRLILTTAPKKPNSKGVYSFTEIISKSFDVSSLPPSGYYGFPNGKVRVHSQEFPMEINSSVMKKTRAGGILSTTKPVEIFLASIPADIDSEIYSATVLQTFNLCPTKYFLKYRLGMPTPETKGRRHEIGNQLDEHDDSILSTVKGEMVHAVLRDLLAKDNHDDTELTRVSQQAINRHLGSSLRKDEAQNFLAQIVENSKNGLDTIMNILRPGKLYLEETITERFGNDHLTGTLDVVTEDEDGLHIFDYKTNRLDRGLDRIYSEYEIQMRFYASLCSKLKPEQNVFDVTIIFTRGAGKYLTRKYSRKEIEVFENEIADTIRKIKAIESADGSYPSADDGSLPTSTPHCSECEYFAGELKRECLLKRR
ncbi:MAG TPA: UvrD-helicase domain-containing protein [Candidatus Acidoferrales bacterium]|nr:UvrD-helicase domain-containing protein [Candidatus Acidoferrales bacterium]